MRRLVDDTLDRYREKRDFDATPEPSPDDPALPGNGNAYLIQKHDATRLHYDLRLELDGVLKSWAVTKGPSLDPSDKRLAVETEDHPLAYGTFEGTIPKGEYGGGTVMLWDRGSWAMADGKDAHEGFAKGSLTFDLFGERLTGRWHLQRLKAEGKRVNWLLIKSRDGAAKDGGRPVTQRFARSVASGRTMADIAKGPAVWRSGAAEADGSNGPRSPRPPANGRSPAPSHRKGSVPRFLAPQLCTARATAPKGDNWLAEVKYDGYRAILRAADGVVAILTRSETDWTAKFRPIAEAAQPLASRDVMLDGEVVIFDDEGRTDFGALQRGFRHGGAAEAVYVAFDLLFDGGEDVRGEPIEARKARLSRLLDGAKAPAIVFGDHVTGRQDALLAHAAKLGLEGIVAKRAGRPYRSGRTSDWVKVRATRTDTFVIGAYTEGGTGGLGALVLGAYEGEALIPVGRCGTGFSAAEARRLLEQLEGLRRRSSPFAARLAGRGHRFVEPELVARVTYLALTDDGQLRHGAFKGLVDDDPRRVMLPAGKTPTSPERDGKDGNAMPEAGESPERAAGKRRRNAAARQGKQAPTAIEARAERVEDVAPFGVTLSNPHKVLFPEQNVTKAALAHHYVAHMERMLPHVAGRPLTLMRCPQGRAKACFYQRHPEGLPARMARDLPGEDGGAIVAQSGADIAELVQRGVLEIHLRGARADRHDRPDRLVFDLDPGEGVDFGAVKDAALTVRDHLGGLDLASFVKTTGGKGLHVVVPIERRTPWTAAKAFCRAVAKTLADAEPARFLIQMKKADRRGRIFIDYLRNDTKSSAVAPYSSRAREGAPFAFPLAWDALERLAEPAPLRVGTVIEGPDPWADMDTVRQRLTTAHLKGLVE